MATSRQLEANRRNAQLSTGPVTEEGKARSRCNALKHGLAGETLVLPTVESGAIDVRIAEWSAALKPRNAQEKWLVELAATESIRIDTAQKHETVLRGMQANRARLCWDDDRRLAVEELALGLAKEPSLVARRLQQTPQGCELMTERWQHLAEIVEMHASWTSAQLSLALDLLGIPPALRENDPRLDEDDPDGCLEVARAEIDRLEQRRRGMLVELDGLERSAAELGLGGEVSRPLALVRRYLAASLRRVQWAWKQLELAQGDRAGALEKLIPGLAALLNGSKKTEPGAEAAQANPLLSARLEAALAHHQRSLPEPDAPEAAAAARPATIAPVVPGGSPEAPPCSEAVREFTPLAAMPGPATPPPPAGPHQEFEDMSRLLRDPS